MQKAGNVGRKSAIWSLRLLAWACPAALYETIEGDLIEQFELDTRDQGVSKARRNLLWNSLQFLRPGILLEHKIQLRWPNGLSTNVNSFQLSFAKANNIAGWLVFALALITYSLTVEETASFWDCSEFIASSYRLEVPHPPGAPLFLMLGRLFSFFSFGDSTNVAYAMNMMSVIASAFTILFLFWSIVLVGRKLVGPDPLSEDKKWLLLISGAVGSLAYSFSDSFWFSAVEAEVYAMSSLSTALVVWCILKWDLQSDESKANRWLILIAYIVGLSIGVHLLNLLTLPALALVYYFKKFKPSRTGIALALTIGGLLILFINDLIVPGLPTFAGRFEIFFVNTLGLFFGSGAIVFTLLIVSLLIFGIRYTQRNRFVLANTFILAFTFILIGYASYTMVVIRSNFNTPINEDAPKDVMSFVSYLKREQYGSRPLLFGPYFTANPIGANYKPAGYIKGKDKYELGVRKYDLEYNPEDETILPRAWSPDFKNDYQAILGLQEGQRPTFMQNLYFMFKHQIGTMYLRYFMWNFAGRESDELGADWLLPTDWFKHLPHALSSNKARNNYFMIPFLLGLIGLFYQYLKDKKDFLILALLFIMLGVAIVVYLNSPPTEPRERDYIYVGSYYAFAFWIGLGVLAISDFMGRFLKNKKALLISATVIGFTVPAIMFFQGWDDHNRSNRFFSTDSASNTLNSCERNGVLFTGGDNDTFPLWYAQETEGCRDDVRVLVLSYCSGDWYIEQTGIPSNQSKSIPRTLAGNEYRQGGPNDYLNFTDLKIKNIDARQYLDLLAKNYPGLRAGEHNIVPSKVITIDIDKKALVEKGVVPKEMEDLVVSRMELKLLNSVIGKSDLLFLDFLVTTNWERPIYLNPSSMSQLNIDVRPYAVLEGNVYRILPVRNPTPDRDFLVNTEKSYDLMINKFKYRGLNDSSIYYTNDYAIQILNHRSNLNSLAEALVDKGNMEKATKVLLLSLDKMPDSAVPYDPSAPDTVSLLFKVGQKKKAIEVASTVADRSSEIASFLIADGNRTSFELRKNIFLLGAMQQRLYENGEVVLARNYEDAYERIVSGLRGPQ